jgi:superfamily I DNA/RNA helicase
MQVAKGGGRVVAVGDPRQAIYSFRGADKNAMSKIIDGLNAEVLPLSVCYRCATSIVEEIQKIEPSVEAAPGAPRGIVRDIPIEKVLNEVKGGDFIVSRTNAPLVSLCFQLLAKGRPAYIQGREVGKSLTTLIEKSKAETVDDLLIWLNHWYLQEIRRAVDQNRPTASIADRRDCLEALCEGRTLVSEVSRAIEIAFVEAEDSSKVRLSSTHRAKGLEAQRVFVIADTYHPEDDDESELNLVYVATSRPISELVYVRGLQKHKQ